MAVAVQSGVAAAAAHLKQDDEPDLCLPWPKSPSWTTREPAGGGTVRGGAGTQLDHTDEVCGGGEPAGCMGGWEEEIREEGGREGGRHR